MHGRAVGIGWRPEIAADLLGDRGAADLVEVVAETCFTQARARKEALAVREMWPVVPHGVKLSLGSADGIDVDRARRLGVLARELRAPCISEHVSFSRGGGCEIGHLTQLPRTMEAVRVVARNVARARSRLPDVPLLLENVAWSFRWPDDAMDEASFYQEVVAATGCSLLLDVANLHANAVNEGLDPFAVLRAYPLDQVAMLHVAGGITEDGFYFDTHAHDVPPAVLALALEAAARAPCAPIVLERDAAFPAWATLRAELTSLRAQGDPRGASSAGAFARSEASRAEATSDGGLAAAQHDVAVLLTQVEAPAGTVADAIGQRALGRARGILQRKRIDDALPLLEQLAPLADDVRAVAEPALARTPRAARGAGPADAWHIAQACLTTPHLRDRACQDALVLRARFRRQDAGLVPRASPFAGFAVRADGTRIVATKGFGANAPVRLRRFPTTAATAAANRGAPCPDR